MSEHIATIEWSRGDQPFLDKRYARAHDWRFDGGAEVRGSSAPSDLVPAPLSDPAAVDPEEALVAALSSCHMLFFLAFAAKAGFVVDRYRDEAVGVLGLGHAGVSRDYELVLAAAVSSLEELARILKPGGVAALLVAEPRAFAAAAREVGAFGVAARLPINIKGRRHLLLLLERLAERDEEPLLQIERG